MVRKRIAGRQHSRSAITGTNVDPAALARMFVQAIGIVARQLNHSFAQRNALSSVYDGLVSRKRAKEFRRTNSERITGCELPT
jgi:hypothetical protein